MRRRAIAAIRDTRRNGTGMPPRRQFTDIARLS
jgi:hypothetical protein